MPLERGFRHFAHRVAEHGLASGFVVTILVFTVAFLSIGVVSTRAKNIATEQLRQDLLQLTLASASQIDPALHDALRSPAQQDSQAFLDAARPLRRLKAAMTDVKYIYTFIQDGSDIRFITDAAYPGDHDGDGIDDQAKIWEIYDAPDQAMLASLATGAPAVSDEPHVDPWGCFISAYAPVRRADGSIACFVGLDVTAGEYQSRIAQVYRAAWYSLLPAAFISLALGASVSQLGRARLRARRALESGERSARETAARISLMNARLELALAAAESGERAKSAFIANMSHEIRTPMTAILGYVDLLSEPDLAPDDRAEYTRTIRRAGDHLLAVINDILDFSKIEAGMMTLELVPVAPAEVLSDVAAMLEGRARAKGLTFSVTLDPDHPRTVSADPTRVRQILVNLVGNAIKFTQSGGIAIRSAYDHAASRWTISILDSGIGMDSPSIASLFRPFTQADASTTRKFGGTGLGLTISKRLAIAMGGDIIVESTPGRGSAFTLAFTAPTDQSAESDSPRPAAEAPLAGRRILLAEDDADSQRLIRFHLERAGALVTAVSDGRAALEAASLAAGPLASFHAIILDIQMPGLGGFETAACLRASGNHAPILALSACSAAAEREQALGAGFSDFAEKPIAPQALIAAVGALCERADTARHAA